MQEKGLRVLMEGFVEEKDEDKLRWYVLSMRNKLNREKSFIKQIKIRLVNDEISELLS
tara:strand:+ start:2792 stop:2965 length:174 start_codon:yes stop_codon:yes gene_type:complete